MIDDLKLEITIQDWNLIGRFEFVGNSHDKILAFCIEPHSKLEIAEHCGYKNTKNFTQKYLRPLLNNGTLKMTLPDKPKSKHQKYITVRSE